MKSKNCVVFEKRVRMVEAAELVSGTALVAGWKTTSHGPAHAVALETIGETTKERFFITSFIYHN